MSTKSPWTKSRYSGGAGGNCVEVRATADAVHVRDSGRIRAPRIVFPAASWAVFIGHIAAP
ncbi:DUF397 domain-containing protein [Streptomyces sp. ET3-23]|uniref:DUF397 domain-containing protein n=1 Tax=Streptomyces sp. ET3-23 TaxID=2885643 RepID=UPI001D118914|nr:DUF397 domain-containing protein [Streptomyces sp. ET3-23]MCC2274638.1 DUF397 domain-containing protein [Streptomyces sp. ET3-23]